MSIYILWYALYLVIGLSLYTSWKYTVQIKMMRSGLPLSAFVKTASFIMLVVFWLPLFIFIFVKGCYNKCKHSSN
jgi:hypothetical protein